MKNVILGTAGHVDHGKTTLIKALTGIDTDRLKEEKERGITIELGFAHFLTPGGYMLGIVDVPGHERFIKTMVSGATGIDMVLLVIAADEGVMPQTREHLQICSLLGIKKGLVAITKIDLVEKDWLDLVICDTRDFLRGSFLEQAAIIPLSAATGEGLENLVTALDQTIHEVERGYDPGILRLPVDRVFTMKGFGTVVTGTMVSGCIRPGDTVHILPARIAAKVRGLQIHNQPAALALAHQRVAVNLQGIDKSSIARGDVIGNGAYLVPSRRLDVHLEFLPEGGKKLKNRSLIRFHLKTSEIMARLIFIDRDELEGGQSAFAQIFLAQPAVAMAGDRFVLRSYSPVTTIGGGLVLDPEARKIKKGQVSAISGLGTLLGGSDKEKVQETVRRAGLGGIRREQLPVKTGLSMAHLQPIIEGLIKEKRVKSIELEGTRLMDTTAYDNLQEQILKTLNVYHEKNPYKEGIPKEELRSTTKLTPKFFHAVLKDLQEAGRIVATAEIVRSSHHRVILQVDMEEMKEEITRIYREAGLISPDRESLAKRFTDYDKKLDDILMIMINEGRLIRIKEDYLVHADVLKGLQEEYRNLLLREGKATPTSFKELTGLSRKYLIPLLEYFDQIKFTIRAGEHRILRTTDRKD